jgi:hypothetical protein
VYCTGQYLTSDGKLKKDITPTTQSIEKVLKLNPVDFKFKTEENGKMGLPSGQQHGLIAEEVEAVLPELVQDFYSIETDEQGLPAGSGSKFKCLNYSGLIPLLIGAIQEQQKQIEELKNQLAGKK